MSADLRSQLSSLTNQLAESQKRIEELTISLEENASTTSAQTEAITALQAKLEEQEKEVEETNQASATTKATLIAKLSEKEAELEEMEKEHLEQLNYIN